MKLPPVQIDAGFSSVLRGTGCDEHRCEARLRAVYTSEYKMSDVLLEPKLKKKLIMICAADLL